MPVRALTAADAPSYRALRLEALRLSPEAFGAHISEEETLEVSEFARRIEPSDRSFVLGAFDQSQALTGTIGWARERGLKAAHRSILWGAYVRASVRGLGLGSGLVGALIARVEAMEGMRQISLHVGAGNEAARALYSKHGFRRVALLRESLQVNGQFIDEELWLLLLTKRDRVLTSASS